MTTIDHRRDQRRTGPASVWQSPHGAVPSHYRGVWRRTLLQTPQRTDTQTTVLWLQTAHWHADLRIPPSRPDFHSVTSLAACTAAQRAFLATQQGFAGATEVTVSAQGELCAWHRRLDLQPPAAGPDAGLMEFLPDRLVETGLYASYLEHWTLEPGSTAGSMVLQRLQEAGSDDPASASTAEGNADDTGHAGRTAALPVELLLVAGDFVMQVRGRTAPWPPGTVADTTLAQMPQNLLPRLLDFSIAFGTRHATGWTVAHASLPWLEGRSIAMTCARLGTDRVRLTQDGVASLWQVLEWQAP